MKTNVKRNLKRRIKDWVRAGPHAILSESLAEFDFEVKLTVCCNVLPFAFCQHPLAFRSAVFLVYASAEATEIQYCIACCTNSTEFLCCLFFI